MSSDLQLMALILGLLKLFCILSLVVGIIMGALLENQLSQNFGGLGFDDQIHSIKVLLITVLPRGPPFTSMLYPVPLG
jgi:hypothetical protein